MFILIIISIAGFFVSALLHFFMLLCAYNPPRELTIVINIGAAFVIYAAILISKRTCGKANIKEFRKTLYNICPEWLKVIIGLLIMYTIAGFVFVVIKKHFWAGNEDAIGNDFQGFSGHWMALYALAFSILYSCKKHIKLTKDGTKCNLENSESKNEK